MSYIEESLRRQRMEKEQAKALREALQEQGIDETTARHRQRARVILGGPSAFETKAIQREVSERPDVRANHMAGMNGSFIEAADRQQSRRMSVGAQRRAKLLGVRNEYVLRSDIIERDGSVCYLCGKDCTPKELHLDHVIPLSRGGSHSPDNLKVSCALCNLSKGAMTASEYVATLDRVLRAEK